MLEYLNFKGGVTKLEI